MDYTVRLLEITLLQVCNEEEQMGQKEVQKGQLEENRAPGNLILEPRLVRRGKRRSLMLNGLKGSVALQTSSHPANPAT